MEEFSRDLCGDFVNVDVRACGFYGPERRYRLQLYKLLAFQ